MTRGSLSIVVILLGASTLRAGDRPNVVFLMADDLSTWGVGVYGNPDARTPNLDRLAREGVTFRQAFVSTPVCSPSRAAMFAGVFPSRLGVSDWINPAEEPDVGVSPDVVGWPEVLKEAGYATAMIGKWHLGTRDDFHPTRQGYDLFHGFRGGGNRPIDPTLEVDGRETELKGSLPDLLTDRALRFVEDHRDGPFLVSLHFRAPHQPYAPTPAEDARALASVDPPVPDGFGLPVDRVKKLRRDYLASVHSIDRNVGRLLARLADLGLEQNTLVIFTSDNGYMIGEHGLWHKGNGLWLGQGRAGHRPNMFDESVRVPFIARWPGKIPAGSTVDRSVSMVGLFPTVLELSGLPVPSGVTLDAPSFAPLMRGEAPAWDDTVFGLYDMHHYQKAAMRMIRTPEWKLIRHLEEGGSDELYHLSADPHELANLSGVPAHASTEAALRHRLDGWRASIDDGPDR